MDFSFTWAHIDNLEVNSIALHRQYSHFYVVILSNFIAMFKLIQWRSSKFLIRIKKAQGLGLNATQSQ